MESNICVGSNHRLAGGHALGDDVLLNDGDLRKVDLHPHITPGHHNAVCHREDLCQIRRHPRFSILAMIRIEESPRPEDDGISAYVGCCADKAGRNIVKALLHTEEE